MARYIVLQGTSYCPVHAGPVDVEVQVPLILPPEGTRTWARMPGDLAPLEVPRLVALLVALRPEVDPYQADPDRGTALMLWFCPPCSEYRWVRLELETAHGGHARVGPPVLLAGSAADLADADWADPDLLDLLLGRGAPWPSPLPAESLRAAQDAAGR
ncbi:hypothetical protein [Micromonospora sp. NPDC005806]|uniref:hypothetical protein n=1 Tax=Micromonospora sp. NPDC005806 TaxID=3364234 RepID=UPI0036B08B79